MRTFLFNVVLMSVLSAPAFAYTPEGKMFGEVLRNIMEGPRHYEGEVLKELRTELLDTSKCIEVPSKEALDYFYKNIFHHDMELMGPKQRAIASVYFETSDFFIFCHKTEDRTHGEFIEYDSIINMEKRDDSFTLIRDFSEGVIIDL